MNNKTILVTGCASGFGMLTAIELAKANFNVYASVINLNESTPLKEAAATAGVNLTIIQLDVTKQESIDTAIAGIDQIDILVNIAGYAQVGLVEDITMEEIRQQLEVNFFGMVATTKAVLPAMYKRRSGKIINITSFGGLVSYFLGGAYCASKFACEGLMEALRLESLPYNVYISNVEPGWYKTNIMKNLRANHKVTDNPITKKFIAASLEKMSKIGGDPQEIAKLIVKIAEEPKPRFRYLKGPDIILVYLKRFLPQGLFEKLMSKEYNKFL